MIELLEKDKQFEWTPACESSFQELKKRLTTARDTSDARHGEVILYLL
jgi:hypothetical protein